MTDKWQAGRLKEVPKAGKDLSNPSNFRGVMLIEVGMKVLSALVNDRLQALLRKVGRESQNGFTNGRGCADSSFCLRSILQTLREHRVNTPAQLRWSWSPSASNTTP